MAGIMAMGDLSHELETLVMQVDNGTVAPNDALFEVVQASLDELARMREMVANGRRVSPARAMIARIKSLSLPEGRYAGRVVSRLARRCRLRAAACGAPPFFPEPTKPEIPEFDTDIVKFGAEIARAGRRRKRRKRVLSTASETQPD